jgi:putative ABC transport system permease protein
MVNWRLVAGDINRRKAQSAMLVLDIAVTTIAMTLSLALRHARQPSFTQTRAATRGPDVSATIRAATGASQPASARFAALSIAPLVRATAGPFPVAFVRLSSRSVGVPVEAEGRTRRVTAIDQPKVVAGTWLRSGGVVLERGLASALGVRVGDSVDLAGRRFGVAGIAVSAAQPFYPAQVPGVVWLAPAEVRRLATRSNPLGYVLALRLANPDSVDSFLSSNAVNTFALDCRRHGVLFEFAPWTFVADHDHKLIALNQKVSFVGSWLLAILATCSIAILVGGRVAEQTRRVGLLKTVGATPLQIAVALLFQTVLLTLGGALVGLAAGSLLAPSFASTTTGLLGSSASASIDGADAVLVTALALILASAATLLPALRAARATTIRMLIPEIAPPHRARWFATVTRRVRPPLSLALRVATRRTRRAVLNAGGLTISVAMIVAALTVQHDLQVNGSGYTQVSPITGNETADQADHILIALSLVLVVLALITATFTAWATVVDSRRSSALARALGATPRDITIAFLAVQLLPALGAACIGIPAGLVLYSVAGGSLSEAQPPVLWLLSVIPVTLVAVAALTAPIARRSAHQSVAEVLRTE